MPGQLPPAERGHRLAATLSFTPAGRRVAFHTSRQRSPGASMAQLRRISYPDNLGPGDLSIPPAAPIDLWRLSSCDFRLAMQPGTAPSRETAPPRQWLRGTAARPGEVLVTPEMSLRLRHHGPSMCCATPSTPAGPDRGPLSRGSLRQHNRIAIRLLVTPDARPRQCSHAGLHKNARPVSSAFLSCAVVIAR